CEQEESPDDRLRADAALVGGFAAALGALIKARREEGAALGRALNARLDEIAALTARAETAPGRQPNAIKKRLAEQIGTLLETHARLDSDRLHQEAVLLASKADIREELDRLTVHVAQAKKLLL